MAPKLNLSFKNQKHKKTEVSTYQTNLYLILTWEKRLLS